MNSKNAAKQFLNASFDASKSANTINYVNSAYMSALPPNQHSTSGTSGVTTAGGAKLSKVGLKHANSNSRQPTNIHMHNQVNNYADGSMMFHGHHVGSRQGGTNSLSQGPAGGSSSTMAGGGSSHKTLYMSQQERMQEIGKVYNYHGEVGIGVGSNSGSGVGGASAANIKIQNQRKNQQVS